MSKTSLKKTASSCCSAVKTPFDNYSLGTLENAAAPDGAFSISVGAAPENCCKKTPAEENVCKSCDTSSAIQANGKLTVVMPVYNELATLREIVRQVLARPEVGELILVNDASTDGTEKLFPEISAMDSRVKVFEQPENRGKGASLIRGFAEAACPYVIVQDADFEYNPEDYAVVLEPLINGKADVVYGSRFMGTPGRVRYFRHEMGNKFLTFFSNWFSDIHLSDMETCYKAFRREVLQNLSLTSQRFGIEVEITAKLAKARVLRIWEVPVSYTPRWYGEGKKIGWRDGIAALWHICRFNLFCGEKQSFVRPWTEVLPELADNRKSKN